ncbi:hypothetical protein N657DRAFT_51133 [Parathielavia appendiculata]|uniref:Rhodopsin domain-containing protein n=1 Tax=Parathielavia appendiculata TaxID=2587402 RepID=A0AAN6UA48_9PEZI|nr:hypothetical protein N657DRAFT_51133 [Parathielavia appendiculata]
MDTPNAAHEPSRQNSVIAASVVMLSLSTITVLLRFYTRKVLLNILGADDCVILAALILSLGVSVGYIRQTHFGLGRHVWLVTDDDLSKYRLEEWYTFLLYATGLSCTKISILLLYRRFLALGWARICTFVVLATVVACSIWVIITSFIDCIPLAAVWDKTIDGKCIDMNVKVGNSYAHIITDFIIFALPIPFVIRLKLSMRQKIGLMVVFCVGFVACLISVIRIVAVSSMDFSDKTYNLATLSIWGSVEVNLAIICACLTTLKPLIVRLFPNLLKSSYMGTPRTLGYIDPASGTAASVHGPRVKHGSASFQVARVDDVRGTDSEGCEMDDLENQIQRGAYIVTPSKAYARLP